MIINGVAGLLPLFYVHVLKFNRVNFLHEFYTYLFYQMLGAAKNISVKNHP